MSEYAVLNRLHKGPLEDPCVEYTAKQAIRLLKIKHGNTILDYGCSIGRAARVFQEHGCKVFGVDVVPEHLDKSATFCQKVYLRQQQTEPLPFERGTFDAIYSSQVIEHLHRRDGEAFIHEAWTLLRGGGGNFSDYT